MGISSTCSISFLYDMGVFLEVSGLLRLQGCAVLCCMYNGISIIIREVYIYFGAI